ncbi:uncharacterized protein LOC123872231 [Maniola jurtina]|uniref:uncharacterized protein LOC123872231 n=1 Tax=Maniola jurtina TaxID=191418 RepID=UPI001E68D2E2|nr:uncharacterized protein LOC123872231 [Maniola jurtina]
MYSKLLAALIFPICIASVEGFEVQENALAEARGKGKYALLTHLAIVLAAKLGLHKILLGIALVLAVITAMVVMAWVLAIVRYVPDFWPHYKAAGYPNHHHSYHPPVHFFYVVATKIFVLKIVYGIIFFVIASKAWHFALWLIHYLKVKDKHKEVYVEYDHEPYHSHHDHHDHHESYVIDDDPYDHQPYGAYSSSYGRVDTRYSQKKKVYDADGSYSVGG